MGENQCGPSLQNERSKQRQPEGSKALLHLYNMKIKALRHGLKPNIALVCAILVSRPHPCTFFHIVCAAVL